MVWQDKALNAAESLKGGDAGHRHRPRKDASYTPRGSDLRRAVVLEADDVAMSLTYGAAVFTRADRRAERPARLPSAERRRGPGRRRSSDPALDRRRHL